MDIVSFIWNIADDCLRDVFQRGQYRDVILPMVVLRRFDALLEDTKDAVLTEVDIQKKTFGEGILDEDTLTDITGCAFFNTSKWTLNRLKSTATDDNKLLCDNFLEYINAFSSNVREVLNKFDFERKARRLADSDRLLSVIEKITDRAINLTNKTVPDSDGLPLPPVSNIEMGRIFEELLRLFRHTVIAFVEVDLEISLIIIIEVMRTVSPVQFLSKRVHIALCPAVMLIREICGKSGDIVSTSYGIGYHEIRKLVRAGVYALQLGHYILKSDDLLAVQLCLACKACIESFKNKSLYLAYGNSIHL